MANFKILSKNEVHYVEVELNNESVRAEAGAMAFMRGQIEMSSESSGIKGFFTSALTGESFFKPVFTGTGTLRFEPHVTEAFAIEMDNESFILDQGAYWASDGGIEVTGYKNNIIASFLSQEGFIQPLVKGTGTVVVRSPGPVEVIELVNDKLVVDEDYAVARSENLKFSVGKAGKSMFSTFTSDEGMVNIFEGTGKVFLAPVPNKNVLISKMMGMEVLAIIKQLQEEEK